jgi:polyhydroxyalkanoate synthesis regulator phasin
MNFEIDETTYNQIAETIHSDNSPVGIDAKKTHILILNALSQLNEKVDRLEKEIAELKNKQKSL